MIEHLATAIDVPLWLAGAGVVVVSFTIRYAVMAGGALALISVFANALTPRRLQARSFTKPQLTREALYSLSSILVFGSLAAAAVAWRGEAGAGALYFEVADFGWIWFACSVPAALLFHDFYFYWTHRLIHHPALFARVHRVHHLSTNPSPLASLAFHPSEAIVNALGVALILNFLPMHVAAFATFGVLAFGFNVLGHLGYELLPARFMRSPAGRWLNTSTSHNLHHRSFNGQYGLYTLIWDRLFGTMNPAYDAALTAASYSTSVSRPAQT